MAAPATLTTLDLTGKYTTIRDKSDNNTDTLKLQGAPPAVLEAAAATTNAGVILKHTKDASSGLERIEMQHMFVGPDGRELTDTRALNLDGQAVEQQLQMWDPTAKLSAVAKRVRLEDLSDPFLKEGWTEDVKTHGLIYLTSEKVGGGFKAEHVWGFADVDGERMYAPRVKVTSSDGEVATSTIVYAYNGPA